MSISTNIVYFISGGSNEGVKIVDGFNMLTMFIVLICCIFNFLKKGRKLKGWVKKKHNKKMYDMKLLSIVFIGYIIFTVFIIRNKSIILSDLKLETIPLLVFLVMIEGSHFLYFIDAIFGLYTETNGKCTGIINKRHEKGSRSRVYYEIYVTDVSNKREIKFVENKYCKYQEGDIIKLIHGRLSKVVIEAEILNR